MAQALTVNGYTYEFPSNRDDPGWGEDATAWAAAVTNVLANIFGAGDILQSAATISNNVVVATNVTGFQLDPTAIRGVVVEYSIYRVTTSTGATERSETGEMLITYKSSAGTWELGQVCVGNSGVTLAITPAGVIQYTSDNMTGSAHSGVMKFRARALTI